MADGVRGAQSLRVRMLCEQIVRGVEPRDLLSQMAAVYYWYLGHHGYLKDPVPAEMVRDPEAVVEEVERTGKFLGDCDCAATFLTGCYRAIGIPAKPIRVGFLPPRHVMLPLGDRQVSITQPTPYSHVLVVARDQYGRTVAVDPVAGDRTWRMLRRTRRFE